MGQIGGDFRKGLEIQFKIGSTPIQSKSLNFFTNFHTYFFLVCYNYLRVVTVRGEGKGETVVTTPNRLDWFFML
jgi:hypothetical protein